MQTIAPSGIGPCSRSNATRSFRRTTASGSSATRAEMSTTTSGTPTSSRGVISGESRPPSTKCPGASMWVAVCSWNVHSWL
jgi:hypothetical protein